MVNKNKLGALQEVHLQFYDSSKVNIILAIKYSDLHQMSKRYLDNFIITSATQAKVIPFCSIEPN